MKSAILFLSVLLCLSCNNIDKKSNNQLISKEKELKSKYSIKFKDNIKPDTTNYNYLAPDIFLLPKIAIIDFMNSKEQLYFTNKTSQCNLFIIPYTDGSITTAILCKEFQIPPEYKEALLAEGIKLNDPTYKPIQVEKIESISGININSTKKEFFKIFGKPLSKVNAKNIETLGWRFKMQESASKVYNFSKLQPFILNGLQYEVVARFKNEELITLKYNYEVP